MVWVKLQRKVQNLVRAERAVNYTKIVRNSMAFVKGQQKKGGKKKGTPNKKTALLKDMILTALDKSGGIDYLMKQATNEPVAFLGLVGKILPKEIDANVKGEIKGLVTVKLV